MWKGGSTLKGDQLGGYSNNPVNRLDKWLRQVMVAGIEDNDGGCERKGEVCL